MFRSLIAGALCAGIVCGAATAQPDPGNTIRIKVKGAELSTPDGARRVALRLRVAAYQVCGGYAPNGREAADFDACRQSAIQRAMAGIDAPLLARALGVSGVVLAQSRQ